MNKSHKKSSFAERLQMAIDRTGIIPAELCRQTGISNSILSEYLHGKTENPRRNKIQAIAAVLNVNDSWLMGNPVPMERSADSNIRTVHNTVPTDLTRLLDETKIREEKLLYLLEEQQRINAIQTETIKTLSDKLDNYNNIFYANNSKNITQS